MKWVLLCLCVLFLLGCTEPEVIEDDTVVDVVPLVVENTSACSPSWVCVSKTTKAYRHENCTVSSQRTCPLGCENDACVVQSSCEEGFKCRGKYKRGFQNTDCSWGIVTECEFGCANATCLTEPEPLPVVEEPVSEPVQEQFTLDINAITIVTVNDVPYEIGLRFLDAEQAQFTLDGERSDMMQINANYTFSPQVQLTLTEILFQQYGVKQAVFQLE